MNRLVIRVGAGEATMTMLVARIDLQSHEFVYASAGHPEPILLNSSKSTFLGQGGMPLGVAEQSCYLDATHELVGGDFLLLYSNGLYQVDVPDASGGWKTLGQEGLAKMALHFWTTHGSDPLVNGRSHGGGAHGGGACSKARICAVRSAAFFSASGKGRPLATPGRVWPAAET